MADEEENTQAASASDDGGGGEASCPKCPECKPGLPEWMGTFSDLVTLLLTFFVLLLTFAKTETSKYDAALGSIRNAIGGNVLNPGKVFETGKSPDDSSTMIDSAYPQMPFPIDFKTTDGILDKREINRESDEVLSQMSQDLQTYQLDDQSYAVHEPEGVKIRLKEKVLFKEGAADEVEQLSAEFYTNLVNLMRNEKWVLFVEGHAASGEKMANGKDAFALSAERAQEVTKSLMKQGIRADRLTAVFYGDSRPVIGESGQESLPRKFHRRVEFILRKRDLQQQGKILKLK